MEVAGGKENKIKVCAAEFVGTFILVTALNLSGDISMGGTGPDAFAAAVGIFISIILFGSISGGHFNPAITTGVFFKELVQNIFEKTLADNALNNTVMYFIVITSQILGGLSAKALCLNLLKGAYIFSYYDNNKNKLKISDDDCNSDSFDCVINGHRLCPANAGPLCVQYEN